MMNFNNKVYKQCSLNNNNNFNKVNKVNKNNKN